jgi:tetratricopeptide (TPR) repeat protein
MAEKRPCFFEPIQWIQIAVIVFACVAVYANALVNDYVYDDNYQILGNPWIKEIKYLPEIFSSNVWSFQSRGSNYYRPLMHVIYMIGYHLFGLRAWGFHLINILWHAGVSVLVFSIISHLMRERSAFPARRYISPPFAAALLFAAHPIHTEVVTPVMGVVDLSMTFFYLLAFFLYIRSGDGLDAMHLLSLASFFLASLCKEPALTLPGVLILYDYAFNRDVFRSMAFLKRYIPYLVIIGIYLLLRLNALQGFAPWKHPGEMSSYLYLINIFPLFTLYLEKLLFPANLNFLHSFSPISSLLSLKGVISLMVTAAFGYLSLIMLKRNRAAFVGFVCILFPLLPALYIPGLSQEIRNAFAERYLYLSSFGFVLLMAVAVARLSIHDGVSRAILACVLAVVLVLYSIGTILRNPVWKNDYTLFADTVKKSPDDAVAHDGLGHALLSRGKTDEAMAEFRLALALKPDFANPYNNIGTVYRKRGRIDQAIEHYQQAIKLEPNFAYAHYNLANAYDELGYIDQAIEHFQFVLRLRLPMPELHNNLGIAYAKKGMIDQAIDQFKAAVKLDSKTPAFRDNLGRARQTKALLEKSKRK